VITALEAEQRGDSLAPLAPHALRAAYWKSAREGLDGHAVDLTESHATVPAQELLNRLVDHVRPALETVGDYDMVCTELARVAEVGNGAMRQRRAWQRSHDIDDVLAEAAAATLE
jgi:carboxylate-amine ligase